MSILNSKLMQLAAQGSLVEVYRDRLAREATVGRVRQSSAHVVLMSRCDELYRYDGVAAVRATDITRIRHGGRELETGALIHGPCLQPPPFPDVALLEISSAITIFQQRFGHVLLRAERLEPDMCFIGEVTDLDDEMLVLQEFGTFKTRDRRELMVALDEITYVGADGAYEARLMSLYKEDTRLNFDSVAEQASGAPTPR